MSFKKFLTEKTLKSKDPEFSSAIESVAGHIYNTYVDKKESTGNQEEALRQTIVDILDTSNPENKEILAVNLKALKTEKRETDETAGASAFLEKFVSNLTSNFESQIGQKIVFVGDSNQETSDQWKQYYGKTDKDGDLGSLRSKPKTDFYTEDESKKVSFKKVGGSNGFTGTKREFNSVLKTVMFRELDDVIRQQSTDLQELILKHGTEGNFKFKAADRSVLGVKAIYKALEKEAEMQGGLDVVKDGHLNYDLFKKNENGSYTIKGEDEVPGLKSLSPNELKTREKMVQALDDDFSEYVDLITYDDAHKKMQDLVETFFNANDLEQKYRIAFLKEALTGKVKFGEDSLYSPSHLMYGDAATGKTVTEELTDEKIIELNALYKPFRISFKSFKRLDTKTGEVKQGEAYTSFYVDLSKAKEKKFFTNYQDLLKTAEGDIHNVNGGPKGELVMAGTEMTFKDCHEMILEEAELQMSMLQEGWFLDSVMALKTKVMEIIKGLWEKYIPQIIQQFLNSESPFISLLEFFGLDPEFDHPSYEEIEQGLDNYYASKL